MKVNKPIRVSDEVKKILQSKKKYKRDTYSDVIKRELMEAKKYG